MSLMRSFYTNTIRIYNAIMHGVSFFHPKAKLWIEGRKDFMNRVRQANIGNKASILIHCSSLGEFEQGRPLLEKLKEQYPNYNLILSFYSPSGFEIEKNNPLADLVVYLPVDTTKKVTSFVDELNIEKAFFIKYEYWPNLFTALKNKGCPIYMVSAIFRHDQFFFKSFAKWYRNHTLGLVDHFFIQNERSADILSKHHFSNYSVTGDTRFDRVAELSESEFSDNRIESFIQGSKKILIAGSSWLEDEKIILEFMKEHSDNWKLILAPHEIHENHLKQIESLAEGINKVRYSQSNPEDLPDSQIIIIDNIGKLKFFYRYADICYIGGGFGAGIHNTLEAAAYGKPVIFGPNYQKFEEAKQLIEIGAGCSIKNTEEFSSTIRTFITPDNYMDKSRKASNYIHQYKGASEKIIQKTMA